MSETYIVKHSFTKSLKTGLFVVVGHEGCQRDTAAIRFLPGPYPAWQHGLCDMLKLLGQSGTSGGETLAALAKSLCSLCFAPVSLGEPGVTRGYGGYNMIQDDIT